MKSLQLFLRFFGTVVPAILIAALVVIVMADVVVRGTR